ncbi:hypothetical protein FHW64_000704 [Variovorax sp. Sphag1AA]|nr:hypothetical protein [Variovorax sp. Sphag1AA]
MRAAHISLLFSAFLLLGDSSAQSQAPIYHSPPIVDLPPVPAFRFAPNNATLSPDQLADLPNIACNAQRRSRVLKIRAHAGDEETEPTALARQRAAAVVYALEQFGLDRSRILVEPPAVVAKGAREAGVARVLVIEAGYSGPPGCSVR